MTSCRNYTRSSEVARPGWGHLSAYLRQASCSSMLATLKASTTSERLLAAETLIHQLGEIVNFQVDGRWPPSQKLGGRRGDDGDVPRTSAEDCVPHSVPEGRTE